MRQILYFTVFLLGSLCFGQVKPTTTKVPTKKVNTTNQTKIPTKVTQPTIPIIKATKPTLSGSWTNTGGNMIYFFKGSGDNIYFLAEEKNINPSWSIVGKAIPGADHVYRFEYGIISETGTFGYGDWILNNNLLGSFMNARSNGNWSPYKGNLVRANSKYKPPLPTATTSVLVAPSRLNQNGIFTSIDREFMLQVKTIGDRVLMVGESVSGELAFIGIGTSERIPNSASESYNLKMDLTSVNRQRTAKYGFILDGKGISYRGSSDCFADRGSIGRYCPDGMMLGLKVRLIPLALYDQNRTADVQQNIERNRRYFDYQVPAATNRDDRMKDADGDGHNSLAYNGDDCDDTNPNKFPGNPEVADFEGFDEDCNPDTIGVMDKDGDGFTDWRVFNKDDKGRISKRGDDCDDNDRSVHPRSTEVCDGKDNDCDGDVDEGVSHLFYRDTDNDGYGDPNERLGIKACYKPSGYTDNNRDCDDSDRTKTTNCN